MNKEKQHLVDLQSKIDQKSKELKQLRKEYETYFSAICKSWREQTNTMFPNLQPCNIGEYVGVDIIYEGLKSASNLNGNLNCSKELEHYAS